MKKLFLLVSILSTSILGFCQISYQQLYTDQSFAQKTVDDTKPVGSIAGTASVSGTGAATYTLPIWCPPGTNGMQPNIALTYSSQSGNGIMGMGWSISGLSAITRVNKDIYHDGEVAPLKINTDDFFALDGVRMVGKSGQYGGANSSYALETEDFSYIVSYHTNNSLHWFSVRKKDGTEYEYGRTTDSRFSSKPAVGVMIWRLNRIIDINGNYIDFEYDYDHNFGRTQVLKKIKYTGNINLPLPPYNTIEFIYGNNRTDLISAYVGGQLMNASHLLKQIKITDENNIVRKTYELSYATDNIHSYFREIKETNGSGTDLNSTIFKYGDIQPSISDVSVNNLTTPYFNGGTFCSDFDGDGVDEVVNLGTNKEFQIYKRASPGNYTMIYEINSTYGGSQITDGIYNINKPTTNYSFYNKTDFNGDGLADFLRVASSNNVVGSVQFIFGDKNTVLKRQNAYDLSIYSINPTPVWNGINFGSCSIAPQDHTPQIAGDFDGDRKTDVLLFFETSGNHYPCMFSYPQSQTSVIGIDFNIVGSTFDVRVADFDGDGKDEIIFLNGSGDRIYTLTKQSNGNYTATLIPATGINRSGGSLFPSNHETVHVGDFNGDGKADVFGKDNNGNWKIGISTGALWLYTNFIFEHTPSAAFDQVVVADYNGDGKTDVFHAVDFNGVMKRSVYYNKGEGFYREDIAGNWDADNMFTGDLNGDGRADILAKYFVSSFNNAFRSYSFRESGRENLLEKVKDGFDNTTVFGYESLSTGANYAKGTSAQYPLVDVKFPWNIVRSYQTATGPSTTKTTFFNYEEAIVNLSGRGFLGFKKVTAETPSVNTKTETITAIDPTYYTSYVTEANTYNTAANQQTTQTTSNISFVQGSVPGTFYQQLLEQTEKNLLTGAATTTTNTYDNNNFGTIISSTTDIDGIETITTATDYVQPGSTTIPCMPDLVTVTRQRTGQSATTDKVKYTYDWMGRVAQKMERYLTNYQVTSSYQYDAFGNVIEKQDVNFLTVSPNPGSLVSYMAYDDKGRFPISATDQFWQTSYTTWDPVWGQPLTLTGIDGITTTHAYNSWGKRISTRLKTGTTEEETISYSDGWDANGTLFYTLVSHPAKPDVKTWYDNLGREVKQQMEHLSGQWTESTKAYDSKGYLITTTAAKLSSEPAFTTNYSYNDPYNRLTSVTDNFGTTLSSYSFLGNGEIKVTVTNAAGQSQSTTTDATGKTIKQEDHGGELLYTYDSRGNLLTVRQWLNTLMIHSYNAVGIKTATWDASAGSTAYTYDAFGRLKSMKTPNSHTYNYRYNELGQMTQRTGPEGTTYYYYHGAGSGLANQLASIVGFNGVDETYSYDNLGRLLSKDKTINGTIYTISYTYDNLDNIIKKQYSDGFYLQYDYNNGYLTTVKNSLRYTNHLLFHSPTINGKGQYSQYTLGNKVTNNTYTHGYLTRTTTPGIQDLEMSYDYASGNLNYREDHLKGLKETFSYDNLNRLTQSQVGSNGPVTIGYDINGGGQSRGTIINKSDIGTFGISSIARTHSAYNQQGQISQQQQDLTYAPFQKTETVTENGYDQSFTYDAGYNRVMTTVSNGGSPELQRLYIDDYEVTTDPTTGEERIIHYLHGGDGLFGIAEIDPYSVNAFPYNIEYHYLYKDHVGSIVTATNMAQNVIEEEQNFDAWGRERNPQTWQYAGATAVGLSNNYKWLYRGYTGHEHMPHFSMINMNGRMYDPLLGRMMSPDPYLMGGTQGYNRYTYALNNPLKYTDPSGNSIELIAAAVIGGVVNWAANGAQFNAKGLGYFAVGALAGLGAGGVGMGVSAVVGNTGFIAGAAAGAGGGLTSGFISGAGNTLISGGDMAGALNNGANQAWRQGLIGGVAGGLIGGIDAELRGRNFWTGDYPTVSFQSSDVVYASTEAMPQQGELNKSYDCPDCYVINDSGHDVYYKPEDGKYGLHNRIPDQRALSRPVDGIATYKHTDGSKVYKIPNGGRVVVRNEGEVYPTSTKAWLLDKAGIRAGWKSTDYFKSSGHYYGEWELLFQLSMIIK